MGVTRARPGLSEAWVALERGEDRVAALRGADAAT
jgi:hypothetical protein